MITYESKKLCSKGYVVSFAPTLVLKLWIYSSALGTLGNKLSILKMFLVFMNNFSGNTIWKQKNLPLADLSCVWEHRINTHFKQLPTTCAHSLRVLWATLPQLVLKLPIKFHITLLNPVHDNHKPQSLSLPLPVANFWSFKK